MTEDQRAARAARRAFIRAQHPDRGGDPDEFARGLRQYRTRPDPGPAESVAARPGRGWRRALRRWYQRRVRRRAGLPPRHLQ